MAPGSKESSRSQQDKSADAQATDLPQDATDAHRSDRIIRIVINRKAIRVSWHCQGSRGVLLWRCLERRHWTILVAHSFDIRFALLTIALPDPFK